MESSTRRLTRTGLLAAAAVVLFIFEGLAPRPLPWMKLGLGNLPVMLALISYGPLAALSVNVIKLFIGGLFSGSLANPAFFIGAGAGMCSWSVMSAARSVGGGVFSAVGLGIWGAVTHQIAQLVLAHVYIGQWGIWTLMPVALLGGLISGILIGLLAHWVHNRSTW